MYQKSTIVVFILFLFIFWTYMKLIHPNKYFIFLLQNTIWPIALNKSNIQISFRSSWKAITLYSVLLYSEYSIFPVQFADESPFNGFELMMLQFKGSVLILENISLVKQMDMQMSQKEDVSLFWQ